MKLSPRRTLAVLALSLSAAACGGSEREQEMHTALRAVASGSRPSYAAHDPEGNKLWKKTQAFYEKRSYAAAWVEGAKPGDQMDELIEALRASAKEGLDPDLYNVSMLEERRAEASKGFLTDKGFDPKEAGALDVWLTYLYMKYSSDIADGLSDLSHADPAWKIKPEKFDPQAHLEKALADGSIKASLAELTPRVPEYHRLRELLVRYKDQQQKGGWPKVPSTRLKPGQKSPHIAALAKRLAASGDYKGSVPSDGTASPYSPQLQEAVKVFQRRHGLTDDGAIGPEVVAALNIPLDYRINQIAMNMERWRWLPRDLGDRFMLVNIPEMSLDVFDNDKVALTMRVVVGKQDTPTPIFNDEMTYLVFSPYWNVPDSIAQGETLPAVINDPGFLQRTNMEVVDKAGNVVDPSTVDLNDPAAYRFRQKPGGDNSLGLVKFMFPNQFNVYLHDTPADSLFERAARSFSHGCVRVEDPVALAQYVLRDQPEWTADRIREAMEAGTEKHVKLKSPIPVFLGYWTARVRPDNTVQFRRDVYEVDGKLQARLNDRLARLRRSGEAAAVATTVANDDADEKPATTEPRRAATGKK
ncbi:MAG: L,D-transpeptidase family protein [Acidobacteriota bacterium]|nr:L,D-transpeptidase family protein [Acidobacteriota bacterium]